MFFSRNHTQTSKTTNTINHSSNKLPVPKYLPKSLSRSSNKSSRLTIKPDFGKRPIELFPGNKAFSLSFHKLSKSKLTPQSAQNTRIAKARIKILKNAIREAEKATKKLHKAKYKSAIRDNRK